MIGGEEVHERLVLLVGSGSGGGRSGSADDDDEICILHYNKYPLDWTWGWRSGIRLDVLYVILDTGIINGGGRGGGA